MNLNKPQDICRIEYFGSTKDSITLPDFVGQLVLKITISNDCQCRWEFRTYTTP